MSLKNEEGGKDESLEVIEHFNIVSKHTINKLFLIFLKIPHKSSKCSEPVGVCCEVEENNEGNADLKYLAIQNVH